MRFLPLLLLALPLCFAAIVPITDPAEIEKLLERHNEAREEVGRPPVVNPKSQGIPEYMGRITTVEEWSAVVAEGTAEAGRSLDVSCRKGVQQHFNVHSKRSENLGPGGQTGTRLDALGAAFWSWYTESWGYDKATGVCDPKKSLNGICAHYMTIIHKDITHIGCSLAENCENLNYILSCNYYSTSWGKDDIPCVAGTKEKNINGKLAKLDIKCQGENCIYELSTETYPGSGILKCSEKRTINNKEMELIINCPVGACKVQLKFETRPGSGKFWWQKSQATNKKGDCWADAVNWKKIANDPYPNAIHG